MCLCETLLMISVTIWEIRKRSVPFGWKKASYLELWFVMVVKVMIQVCSGWWNDEVRLLYAKGYWLQKWLCYGEGGGGGYCAGFQSDYVLVVSDYLCFSQLGHLGCAGCQGGHLGCADCQGGGMGLCRWPRRDVGLCKMWDWASCQGGWGWAGCQGRYLGLCRLPRRVCWGWAGCQGGYVWFCWLPMRVCGVELVANESMWGWTGCQGGYVGCPGCQGEYMELCWLPRRVCGAVLVAKMWLNGVMIVVVVK